MTAETQSPIKRENQKHTDKNSQMELQVRCSRVCSSSPCGMYKPISCTPPKAQTDGNSQHGGNRTGGNFFWDVETSPLPCADHLGPRYQPSNAKTWDGKSRCRVPCPGDSLISETERKGISGTHVSSALKSWETIITEQDNLGKKSSLRRL